MSDHASYRFSVTIHSDDLAVVNCLRALSQYSQRTGNNRIPWGGTKDADWTAAGHRISFRFSRTDYRDGFIDEARRLLPHSLWTVEETDDDDPARPQASGKGDR